MVDADAAVLDELGDGRILAGGLEQLDLRLAEPVANTAVFFPDSSGSFFLNHLRPPMVPA